MNQKDKYISLIVDQIRKEQPEKIILFGSYAYGTPDYDSDIDLLIIKNISESELRDFRIGIKMKLWELIKKWNVPIDIIVDNQERIDQRIQDGDMFYKEIITRGNVIYA